MPSFQIIEKTLHKIEVFPSSIPHFLHWDIAYLWMLEREPGERTKLWNERIAAWKRLVALLLLDNLRLEEEPLAKPFSEYAGQLGIQKVVWVFDKKGKHPLGVLSPTVLVRPLPDFKPADLDSWPKDPSVDRSEGAKLGYFVEMAVRVLQQSEGIPVRLAEILRKEFKALKPGQPEPGFGQAFPFLERIEWVPGQLETKAVPILVYTPEKRHYIPLCPKCHSLLTKLEGDEPVPVLDGQTEFAVSCPACKVPTPISLCNLMIWQRPNTNQVMVWEDRTPPGVPKAGVQYPPPAIIQGETVTFEWSEGETRGDPRRFLKLKFEGRKILPMKFDQIRFHSLLVLGSREQFKGLPIRPEWRNAVEALSGPTWDDNGAKYTFQVQGWPFAFDYYAVILQDAPDLFLGIYPDYIPGWKRYRVFVVGEKHEDYNVGERSEAVHDMRQMPWCMEREGWPKLVGVVSRTSPKVGMTVDVPAGIAQGERAGTELLLGIDFGTTNSLVYFAAKGEGDALKPGNHAVAPRKLAETSKVLAGSQQALTRLNAAYFLPNLEGDQELTPDDYLIPSAFWEGGEFPVVVRWANAKPFSAATPQHGFKWDSPNQDMQNQRREYLQELMFLVLPYAIKKEASGRQFRLSLGWAFPLAFGTEERSKMKKLLRSIDDFIRSKLIDVEVESYSIDESRANVRARGQFNPGDTLLVADMGGGTLDLAVFTFRQSISGQRVQEQEYEQIGSIRFGGEGFLECVIESKGERTEYRYWAYRDAITNPAPLSPIRRDKIAETRLGQFITMAFEFLRTMYCALPGESRNVKIILAGNGWRLIEAIRQDTCQLGSMRVFNDFYSPKTQSLGYPGLSLYVDSEFAPPLRKHCVAQGALWNADDQKKELEEFEQTTGSKLPAGRNLRFRYSLSGSEYKITIAWNDLVGEAGKRLEQSSKDVLQGGTIEPDFESGPPAPPSWQNQWPLASLPEPAKLVPTPERMKDWLGSHLEGMAGSVYLRKGPLQLLMEKRWLDYLRERG